MSQVARPDNNEWPDLAGRLTDFGHALGVRVYFEDTDFSGVVYHANYLKWFERGRSDFLRLLDIRHDRLLEGEGGRPPAAFVVRRIEIDYRAPAHIDEALVVETRVAELAKAFCWLEQRVVRDGQLLAQARVQVVLVSLNGRPLRLGDDFSALLGRFANC